MSGLVCLHLNVRNVDYALHSVLVDTTTIALEKNVSMAR